jgi:hypothetical protein
LTTRKRITKLLLDSEPLTLTMAKQQSVVDATISLVKGGKDASEVIKRCKSLVKDDLLLLIGLLSSLVVENAGNASGVDPVATATTATTTTTTTTAEKEGGPATTTATPAENAVVIKSPPSYLSVVKSGFGNKQTKQTTVTPTGKICKKLMDTGACEEKKCCQHLHPVRCSYYASFGLARINPKGCKSNDCKFLHVVICRFKYKALCKKQLCSLQHLQPEAVEKKAKVQPVQPVQPVNVHHQPKKAPTTASFLDQGLDQRMSKIEGLLMMMIQQRGLPPAHSGWPLGTLGGAYSNVSLK